MRYSRLVLAGLTRAAMMAFVLLPVHAARTSRSERLQTVPTRTPTPAPPTATPTVSPPTVTPTRQPPTATSTRPAATSTPPMPPTPGHPPPTSQAQPPAGTAATLPAIPTGPPPPLALGRKQPLSSTPQRTALAPFYDECATPGCPRPYAWTELHHLDPWTNHGKTDLNNAIPLCGHHHRRIHDPALNTHIHTTPKGIKTIAFTPQT